MRLCHNSHEIVTFLKVSLDTVDATWHVGHAALQFVIPKGLRIDSNDLAGNSYRKVTSIRLRHACTKLLVSSRSSQPVWTEAAYAGFSACLDIYESPAGRWTAAKDQADFLAAEDAPTGRARSLIALHGFTDKRAIPIGKFLIHARIQLQNDCFPAQQFGMGDLYLTRLRLPDASNPPEPTQPTQPTRLRHSLYQDDRSDSEVDEGVSEAMRDARLACVSSDAC
jgi:hypothetical protein